MADEPVAERPALCAIKGSLTESANFRCMTRKPELRLRLKADGRIVEVLPDGQERDVAHKRDFPHFAASQPVAPPETDAAYARAIRAATRLTQAEFAARIGVPLETVRNWEQGKRAPRGPARALLKLLDRAPDLAFAVLGAPSRRG
jgi:putative transcriptional regulator